MVGNHRLSPNFTYVFCLTRNSNNIYNICNVRSFAINSISYIIDLKNKLSILYSVSIYYVLEIHI